MTVTQNTETALTLSASCNSVTGSSSTTYTLAGNWAGTVSFVENETNGDAVSIRIRIAHRVAPAAHAHTNDGLTFTARLQVDLDQPNQDTCPTATKVRAHDGHQDTYEATLVVTTNGTEINGYDLTIEARHCETQLEQNDAGGSLRDGSGQDQSPGTPKKVNPGDSMDIVTGGAPGAGYALLLGGLACSSTPIPVNNEFLDLDQSTLLLLGNGLGAGGGLPPVFFVLNGLGESRLTLPTNDGVADQTFAFQSIVFDPTMPLQINFTAAILYEISSASSFVLTGDDAFTNFGLSDPLTFYGQSFTSVGVSTNGWIRCGAATFSDLAESAADFENGLVGDGVAAPACALLWEDLDMGNRPSQGVEIDDLGLGGLRVAYVDADYFSSTPFGCVECTIDGAGGNTVVTLDYTGYTAALPPTEGLVGVTDGRTTASAISTHDIVQAGAVNPFFSLGPTDTIYQSFDGAYGGAGAPLAAEPLDVGGLVLTIVDAGGAGDFSLL